MRLAGLKSARKAFNQLHIVTPPDEIFELRLAISYNSGVEMKGLLVLSAGPCKKVPLAKREVQT